ncbi:hypothetical protein ACRWOO_18330 [Streptomyces sp. NEAU-PBA10]|uniref:Uncharacterized protein n=1 Tax=Streptomyces tremellae TaxID=1124239 RepID=A0ABP7DZR3_9ACTN
MTSKSQREIDRAIRQYQTDHPGTSLSAARRAIERRTETFTPPARLAHVVPPRAGESLEDWIGRLAEANEVRRHRMMELLGLEPGRSALQRLRGLAEHMPDHTVNRLHAATGIDAEQARAMAAIGPKPDRKAPMSAEQAADHLHGLLAKARAQAETEGLPPSSSWSLPFVEPHITRLGGAAALRTAAKRAARRLRMSIRVTVYRREGDPDQLITVNNQGPFKTVKRDPVDTLTTTPFTDDLQPGPCSAPCDCRHGYCISGTDTYFGSTPWPGEIWNAIRPDTDLRTLPEDYRTTYDVDMLFAQLTHRDFDDYGNILDLTPFLDGAELGPLADVQVYATNARGHYRGRSHGALCQHADTRSGRGFGPLPSQQHEILPLAELVEILRPLHHSRRHQGLGDLIGPGAARRDRDLEDRWCSYCGGYSIRRFATPEACAHYRAERERWSQLPDDEPRDTADDAGDPILDLLSKADSLLDSPAVQRIFDAHDRAMGAMPAQPHDRP